MAALRSNTDAARWSSRGTPDALYERHLLFDNVLDPAASGARERYEAFARSVRDVLSQRWVRTEQTYERANPKRVYYLSMEFLIGRSLSNNITNLLLESRRDDVVKRTPLDWLGLLEEEPDAGLGNGGLGRLPRASSTRWRRCSCRPWVRAPVRVRMFRQSIEDGGSTSSPTTGFAVPIPGRSSARTTRSRSS
jgi:starch phosphorylase